jgi:hypothetical protein
MAYEPQTPQAQPVSTSRVVSHPFLGYGARARMRPTEGLTDAVLERMCGSIDAAASWRELEANQSGYFARGEYPLDCSASDYVVAVFGGSVAQWWALQADVAARITAAGYARRPMIVNASFHGHKQPQSLIGLTLMLLARQRIDVAVVIDGFNELALSRTNEVMGYWHAAPCALYLREVWEPAAMDRLKRSSSTSYQQMADEWELCSRLMHSVCTTQGIRFVHVQPNQYYERKTFTAFEREHCLSSTTPYREPVEHGYPLLALAAARLRAGGINCVDATSLFAGVTDTTYADNCCHLSALGNSLLTGRILAELAPRHRAAPADETASWLRSARSAIGAIGSRFRRPNDRSAAAATSHVPDDVYPLW